MFNELSSIKQQIKTIAICVTIVLSYMYTQSAKLAYIHVHLYNIFNSFLFHRRKSTVANISYYKYKEVVFYCKKYGAG